MLSSSSSLCADCALSWKSSCPGGCKAAQLQPDPFWAAISFTSDIL